MEGSMKRIILGFLFVFMFCGSVYSMDWSGTYELMNNNNGWDGGELKIKKNGSSYKVEEFNIYQELGRSSQGFCLENENGVKLGNSLELYSEKDLLFKLVKNGNYYNIIPVYKQGTIVPWCGPGSGSSLDNNDLKIIGKLRWKKVK